MTLINSFPSTRCSNTVSTAGPGKTLNSLAFGSKVAARKPLVAPVGFVFGFGLAQGVGLLPMPLAVKLFFICIYR